jgi:opacity protein-like surface antigen
VGLLGALLAWTTSLSAIACQECYCGFYGQFWGGVNLAKDAELAFNPTGIVAATHTDVFDYEIGWTAGAAVGHQWSSGMAIEFEASHRANDVDTHRDILATSNAEGDIGIWAFFSNAYYRFNCCQCIVPYLGVGIGIARLSIDNTSPSDAVIDDNDSSFVWQGIVGASYCVCDCWDLFLEYRFFDLPNTEWRTPTYRIESDFRAQQLQVGIRWVME